MLLLHKEKRSGSEFSTSFRTMAKKNGKWGLLRVWKRLNKEELDTERGIGGGSERDMGQWVGLKMSQLRTI